MADYDGTIVRKLKAVNYGKWYMRPDDFNRKIEQLNTEIKKKLDDSHIM